MITLRAYGEARFEVGRVTITSSAARPFACLLRLTAARGRPIARATLAAMCWPDAPPTRARHALRQLLYRLRRAGVPLTEDGGQVALPAGACPDRATFEPTVATVRAVLAANAGEWPGWLPDYAPSVSLAFADWFDALRTRVDGRLRDALADLLADAEKGAQPADVASVARALLALDPLHPDARSALDRFAPLRPADVANPHLIAGGSRAASVDARVAGVAARAGARDAMHATSVDDGTPTIIGRDAELATLARSVYDSVAGRGHVFLVCGAAGAGTTSVLRHAGDVARANGAAVVSSTDASSRGTASNPVTPIVDRLLTTPGALGSSPASLALLRQWVAASRSSTVGSLDVPAPVDAALGELVDAVAEEQALVLLVDGVDAGGTADGDAVDRLLAVLQRASRGRACLAVVGIRLAPGVRHGAPDRWLASSSPRQALVLPPLDDETARSLIAARVADGVTTIDEADRDWCVRHGRGLPARLVAYLRACEQQPGTRVAPLEVRRAAAATLDQRSSAERQLVQAIAVLAEHATPARVTGLIGGRLDEAQTALVDLASAGIVVHAQSIVAIADSAVAECSLGELGPVARASLHRRAARSCEHDARALNGDERSASLASAAIEYWVAAGEAPRAVVVATALADGLRSSGRPGPAATLLERAAAHVAPALGADHGRATDLRVAAIDARLLDGHGVDRSACHHQLTGATAGRAPRLEVQWLGGATEALLAQARDVAANEALPIAERLRAVVTAVACGEAMGVDDTLHDVRDVVEQCDEMARAGEARAADGLCVLQARMAYHVSYGSLALGVAAARELEDRLDRRPQSPDLLRAYQNVAEALSIAGLVGPAAAAFERGYAAAVRYGAIPLAMRAAERSACLAIARHDVDDAERWLSHADRWHRLRPRTADACELRDTRLRLRLLGDATSDVMREAIDAWAAVSDPAMYPARVQRAGLTTAVEAHLTAGTPLPAGWVPALESIHRRFRARTAHDRTVAALARVLMQSGRPTDAARLAHRYLSRERRALGPAPRVLRDLCGDRLTRRIRAARSSPCA